MVEIIKRIAKQTLESCRPACYFHGTVTCLAPLTVRVDGQRDITAPALQITKEMQGHSHALSVGSTQTAQALAVGETVIVLQNLGGQHYLILGRA